jgi:predicted RNA-binding protein with RPS1 domain
MPYGAFIELPECGDKMRGLCHKSELASNESDDPFRNLSEGQDLEVEIIRIDEKGRLGLSHRAVAIRRERAEVEAVQKRLSNVGSMQSLGDLLKGIKINK